MKLPEIDDKHIAYRSGYKHQLAITRSVQTTIFPKADISTDFISLTMKGVLTVYLGYAWDGMTWFPDLKCAMRASLFHDALAQLMRMELISMGQRKNSDELLRDVCIHDGMYKWVAKGVYIGVRKGGQSSVQNKNAKKVRIAP